MATKTKSPVAQVEAETPHMYDRRPGDLIVRNVTNTVVFAVDRAARVAYTDQPGVAFQPGVDTLLPGRMAGLGTDVDVLLKRGTLVLVDADRGVLPQRLDLQDNAARAIVRDGHVPDPPEQSILDALRGRYLEATDRSVAQSIHMLMRAGWDEADAAKVVIGEYREAVVRGDGSVGRRSWVALVERIVATNGKEDS